MCYTLDCAMVSAIVVAPSEGTDNLPNLGTLLAPQKIEVSFLKKSTKL